MAKLIVLDEIHLTVLVPDDLPETECVAIRQTLTDALFEGRLRRIVRRLFSREPSLSKARVRLSR